MTLKWQVFLYGLITFYEDVMETLYNVFYNVIVLSFENIIGTFSKTFWGCFIFKYAGRTCRVCLLSKHLKQSISNMLVVH